MKYRSSKDHHQPSKEGMNEAGMNHTWKDNFSYRGKTPAGAKNRYRRRRINIADLCEAKKVKMKLLITA